ncbi:MAG: LytR/AlgR family response regulator transcription factor [Hungatella hathewayi]
MVFMDIYLEQEDGMQVIRELRKTDKDCPVVFFTRSTDHAVEAFEVNAVHYLTKPLVYEKLADALSRCEKLHEKQAAFLLLPTEKKLRKVRLAEILYIEVFDNTCVIHLDGETIPVRIPLKNLETKIREVDAHSDFLRCHRSYLVNMNWIMALRNDYFLLDTGHRFPSPNISASRWFRPTRILQLKKYETPAELTRCPKEDINDANQGLPVTFIRASDVWNVRSCR